MSLPSVDLLPSSNCTVLHIRVKRKSLVTIWWKPNSGMSLTSCSLTLQRPSVKPRLNLEEFDCFPLHGATCWDCEHDAEGASLLYNKPAARQKRAACSQGRKCSLPAPEWRQTITLREWGMILHVYEVVSQEGHRSPWGHHIKSEAVHLSLRCHHQNISAPLELGKRRDLLTENSLEGNLGGVWCLRWDRIQVLGLLT